MYVIDHRVDGLHFDDRAVDAVFEQTLSLVILSSFGCLSPHSEGAIYRSTTTMIYSMQCSAVQCSAVARVFMEYECSDDLDRRAFDDFMN